MKKLFSLGTAILMITLFLLSACGQDAADTPPTPDNTDSVTAQTAPSTQTAPVPSDATTPEQKTTPEQAQEQRAHSAMNSLDYFGTYAADAQNTANQSGIARLSLYEDGSCLLVMQDGKKVHDTYKWDASGSIIHIGPENFPALSFFVGEGFLILGSTTPHGDGPRFTQQQDGSKK